MEIAPISSITQKTTGLKSQNFGNCITRKRFLNPVLSFSATEI